MSYNQQEVAGIINNIGTQIQDFKTNVVARIDALETVQARSGFVGGGSSLGGSTTAAAKEHQGKFLAWARKGSDPDGLRSLEVKALMQTQDDPSGGYLVPVEMDHSLDRLAIDSVAMRRLANIVTATGDYKRPLSVGGAGGGWVGEVETRTETDSPELRMFAPPWSELYALPEITQALLDMSDFDVAAWLQYELMTVETEMEGTAFINGNGVKQPHGILQYETVANASWEWGKVGFIAGGHASLLNNADKLRSLKHALKPAYRRNGVFLMTDTTQEVISNFKDGNGNYIWRAGLTEDAPDTLLGRPIEIDDNMDEIGANKYPIAFADWKRCYTIGDHKVGRRLIRDPFTKKGFIKFYLVKRVFGGIYNHQAVKFLKVAA